MTLGWHFCFLSTCLVHACSDALTTYSFSFLNCCTSGSQMKSNLGKPHREQGKVGMFGVGYHHADRTSNYGSAS